MHRGTESSRLQPRNQQSYEAGQCSSGRALVLIGLQQGERLTEQQINETDFMLNESFPKAPRFGVLRPASKEVGGVTFCAVKLQTKLINACIILNFLRSGITGSVKNAHEIPLRVFDRPYLPRFHQASPRIR
jgi:hypothetical protein